MTPDIIQYILSQGGLAGFAIWMLVQAHKDKEAILALNKADVERYALINREDKILLLAALDRNNVQFTVLNTKVDTFSASLEAAFKQREG